MQGGGWECDVFVDSVAETLLVLMSVTATPYRPTVVAAPANSSSKGTFGTGATSLRKLSDRWGAPPATRHEVLKLAGAL